MTEGTTMPAERDAIVRIAKGLTEAQRRRLEIISDAPVGGEKCRSFTGHGNAACNALLKAGLAHKVGNHGLGAAYQVTTLGLAVHSHLKESTHE